MNEIEVIYNFIREILEDESMTYNEDFPPIFSFEGLPGVGKTTQIERVSYKLGNKYGKSYYIDLPTNSTIGLFLKTLYSNKKWYNQIKVEAPWINPFLLTIDLQLELQKAKKKNINYILMARGILSTYYFNFDAYMNTFKEFDIAWENLNKMLQKFIKPTAIIFFELSVKETFKRVMERNRWPLREMDKIENMTNDSQLFYKIIELIKQDIPIHYIQVSRQQ